MLKNLYIKNFILIKELNLDFNNGFSAFTGETGAGKSIFIDAISLLSDKRASSSLILEGEKSAIIEGTFSLKENSKARNVLNDAGFEFDDEVTFTREIKDNGKSVARIDHRIVNLSLMQDVLQYEIDIHNQGDNSYLMKSSNHLELLDFYCQNDLKELNEAYNVYHSLVLEKSQMLNETYNESDIDFFNHQIDEIEEANLKIGEDEELQNKEKNYLKLKNEYDKLSNIFNTYEEVSNSLYNLNKDVQSLKLSGTYEELQSKINDSYYSFIDSMDEFKKINDTFDMSEDEINEMENRLFIIQKLKRKYGNSIELILEKKEELVNKIELINDRQKYIDEIDKKIKVAKDKYDVLSKEIHERRVDGAKKLDKAIMSQLKDLLLEKATFVTSITYKDDSLNGNDKVEFLVSMNEGHEPQPLVKCASGGEISRLMLGLKVIFTSLQGVDFIVFDEIDTGVSGKAANAIGSKMKMISKSSQVFAITHLAPVASFSDYHYLVSKEMSESKVTLLNNQERIEQLALMANGEITDNALKASEELLRRNQVNE